MKSTLPKLATTTAVVLTFSLSVFAQVTDKRVSQKNVSENGQPSLITFSNASTYKGSDSQKIFKEQLGLKETQSFAKIKTESDPQGYTHEKFQLYEQGIKVEFANYSLHSKDGKLVSMNGEFYNIENVKITPKLSAQDAFNKAIAHTGAKQYLWETPENAKRMRYEKPKGELVFLPSMENQGEKRTTDKVRLAYKFDIYATKPLSRGNLYIDAETGDILFYNATIKHSGPQNHREAKSSPLTDKKRISDSKIVLAPANAATRYSGSQTIQTSLSGSSYILYDLTRGGGIQTYNSERTDNYATTNFTDADNNWTAAEFNNVNKDNGALDAHWGAQMTYDYWFLVHGRNSFDNAGTKIDSYVHFNLIAAGLPDNNNAAWDGSAMVYGDGNATDVEGSGFLDILTSLDQVGHEIGHAICSYTAELVYQKESGALNEGFSDIWSACIKYRAVPAKSIWEYGDEIDRRLGKIAPRSVIDPKREGYANTYGGINWRETNNCTPNSNNDLCGVHYNSTVLSHWFYILSVGKTGTNDIGSTYNVTGISIEKAEKIAYCLESVYLTPNSTFANARLSGIQSAIDLFGANSPEVIATTNAFYAVGVGSAYVAPTDTIAPTAPTNLTASTTTATSTNLSWTASTDNVAVTGYNIYQGTTLKGSSTTTSYTITGLTASTVYSFSVKAKDAAENISSASNTVSIMTPVITYCESSAYLGLDEKINKVVFGTINNLSIGIGGYENFTSLSTNTRTESSNTITITPAWSLLPANKGYSVFIDYNQDGDFTDEGEIVCAIQSATSAPVTGTITIPATATLGTTRMRISMKNGSFPSSCENSFQGQVEDYSINIISNSSVLAPKKANALIETTETPNVALYPNPVDNELNISLPEMNGATFIITNNLGQQVISGELSTNHIDVAQLNTGIYIIELKNDEKRIVKKFIKR